MKENKNLTEVLKAEARNVNKAAEALDDSYGLCKNILIKASYPRQESVELEALTSRFARLCDILLQKAWRALFLFELEDDGSLRDRINRAEKKRLIDNAEQFTKIRLLRNRIAHEYDLDELNETYQAVLNFAPILLESAKKFEEYVTAELKRQS